MFETREKEHKAKIRLTKKDLEEGKIESSGLGTDEEYLGIARHSTHCKQKIDWEKSTIVVTERNTKQRKVRGHRIGKTKIQGENTPQEL